VVRWVACSRRNRRPGPAESSLPLIFTDDADSKNCALVKVLTGFSIFGNFGDFGNFLLLLSAWTPTVVSLVQSVVQKVFPRLLIDMFSSQMRSYTKLSINA
jgi:hypothetical protein